MAVVVLAMTMTVSACGKAAARTSQTEVAPMAQANTIATENQEKKAPDLFGNPDMSKLMKAQKGWHNTIPMCERSIQNVGDYMSKNEKPSFSGFTILTANYMNGISR